MAVVKFTPIIEEWKPGEGYEGVIFNIRTNPPQRVLALLRAGIVQEDRAQLAKGLVEVIQECNIEGFDFSTEKGATHALDELDPDLLTAVVFFVWERKAQRLEKLRSFRAGAGDKPIS